jgi:hypothetical protein
MSTTRGVFVRPDSRTSNKRLTHQSFSLSFVAQVVLPVCLLIRFLVATNSTLSTIRRTLKNFHFEKQGWVLREEAEEEGEMCILHDFTISRAFIIMVVMMFLRNGELRKRRRAPHRKSVFVVFSKQQIINTSLIRFEPQLSSPP